jgi:HAD superfamily hydrolase (TIGR01490 family)
MNAENGIAAFFDLDGTLLARPSLERRFIGYLLRRRLLRFDALLNWLVKAVEYAPGASFAGGPRYYLRGLSPSRAEEWIADLREPLPFFAEPIAAIEWHSASSHRVFIVSGTLAPLARGVARQLPGDVRVCATELETDQSNAGRDSAQVWSGRLSGEAMNGVAKARAIQKLAARYELDLARCFAYGDSVSDSPMLSAVGNPRAVNAGFRLRRMAQSRGWPILTWHRRINGVASETAETIPASSPRAKRGMETTATEVPIRSFR